jgi:hypothetical protein
VVRCSLTPLNRSADQAEKELLKTLADKEPTFAEITHCLNESVNNIGFGKSINPNCSSQVSPGLPKRHFR